MNEAKIIKHEYTREQIRGFDIHVAIGDEEVVSSDDYDFIEVKFFPLWEGYEYDPSEPGCIQEEVMITQLGELDFICWAQKYDPETKEKTVYFRRCREDLDGTLNRKPIIGGNTVRCFEDLELLLR